MAVINITIVESSSQVISGIPKSISLTTNIPSTIFYTVDGTEPTSSSSVYIGTITLPTNYPSVTFKAFATNGSDTSAVISQFYGPQTSSARQPRDTVIGLSVTSIPKDNYPFGNSSPEFPVQYGKSGGITVDDPDVTNIPDGFDGTGTGTPASGTDLPLSDYKFIYSTANSEGETGPGIGTLPGKATIRVPAPSSPSSSSNTSDRFFNPKAMVIYQDSRNPSPDDVSQLNRAFFSLANPEIDKSGALLMNSAFDSSSVTGTFLKAHFNPRDNTLTYYYRDSETNRWIISKEPYSPRNENIGCLYKVVFSSRDAGAGFVYKWLPFMSRKLI